MTAYIYLPTMEPGQPEAKRPRHEQHSPSPWGTSQHPPPGPLPPPQPSQQLPSLSPYQSHNPYSGRHQEHQPHPSHHQPDHRRHHEQEPYPHQPPPPPHMQDPRPPPSPAHPPPHYSYRRDSIVKRESGDDNSLPQMRRPNSTGTAPEVLPPPQHGLPPYSGPHVDDHRRPPSFDNGASIPPSPQVYRQSQPPYHAPPTPIAQHNQYEASPSAYGPPPPMADMYSSLPISSAKRKAQRASQACDMCRQLKAKCDEQRPCKNCKDKHQSCVYRDLPTKQPDKVSADILDVLGALKDQMTNIDSRIERLDSKFDRRISRLEDKLVPSDQLTGMKVESVEEDRHDYNSPPAAGVTAQESNEEQSSSPGNSNGPDSQKVADAQELLRRMDHDNLEKDPGEPVHPGQPSLPAGHTTLAAFLLKWPSIKALVHEPLAKEGILHINDFPVGQEQQRGPLRVWGRGEGYFAGNKHDNQVMTDLTGDSPSANVDAPSPYSDSAISTDRDAWGPVGLPATQGVEVYKGGMPANEGLFDRAHVKQYVKSFEDNVLNMHPILIPKQLHAMVTIFLDQLPQANPKPTKNPAKFVQTIGPSNSHAGTDSGLKRKRSPALDDQSPGIAYQKSGVPNRSIESALVLAVLALGKICLWKSKIPELVPDHEPAAYSSPSVRNGTLSSPAQGSPPGLLSTQASSLPSPKEPERSLSSRRPSLQGANPGLRGQNVKRNLDVIPGLEYFGMAADILGTHMGEFNLKSVYTALFLGLYHGQLGRVLESWSYIALAGRQLQVVLRPSLSRLSKTKRDFLFAQTPRDNQFAFAFWTCLQLESDILAELPMPHSGILSYEDLMPYPDLTSQANTGFPHTVLSSYQAQLWVRRQLNKVHQQLYSLEKPTAAEPMEAKMRDLQQMLDKVMWVPPDYSFQDDDPPAKDILTARLRAKYWGSQVILYRKFIDMVLHDHAMPEHTFKGQPPHPSDWAAHKIELNNIRIPHGTDPRVLNFARLGVSALIESTRAFHGLEQNSRILVTNVFTTAHAQWGNLLVLSACYNHSVLRQFIPEGWLERLFSRTIQFFTLIAHATSPLRMDLNILISISRQLGFDHYDNHADPNSSFSSMNSTGHTLGHTPGGTPTMLPPPHSGP